MTVRGRERAFVVLRTRGSGWDDATPLEDQRDRAAHAAFMDGLFEAGFVAFAGPMEGTRDARLVLRAQNEAEVIESLAADPWTRSGHLVTKQINLWIIRLGSLAKS